jgi:hypothetical protein
MKPEKREENENMTDSQGKKDDDGKPRMDLIPSEALFGLAQVLTFGAKKYAPRNWEKGLAFSRVFAAAQRHLWAWQRGEDLDPETGLSHLHHAACCIAFLQTYTARGQNHLDDRPNSPTRPARRKADDQPRLDTRGKECD